ncbi:MAG: hypothetical protein ACPGCM_12200 [Alteromonas oceani]|tara:strand:+ start:685 stop:1461 length:777 start_codon:yes stop_codon:yes gene_type:complete
MKVLWISLIVFAAVAGFLVGRASAPTASLPVSESSTDDASVVPSLPTSAPENTETKPIAPVESTSTNMSASPATSQPSTYSRADVGPDSSAPYSNDLITEEQTYEDLRRMAQDNYPAAQQELDEWAELHKADLKSRMEATLGESSDFMFEEVLKDNAMLNEPLAQQPMEEDFAWREQAQVNIHDYIVMNSTDPSLEVLNITCMQKKCEVTLTGKDDRAGIILYMQMMQIQPFGITGGPSPTTMMNDDGSYWMYMLLTF